jgi:DNA-binding beta-propeller fold protein YncE
MQHTTQQYEEKIGRQLKAKGLLIFGLVTVAACGTGGIDDIDNNDDNMSATDSDSVTNSDPDGGDGGIDTDTAPSEGAPYTKALVITSDYQSGAYGTIDLSNHEVEADIGHIHSDAVCRFDPVTNTPFIIQRMDYDAVAVLDPDTFEIDREYSVGAGSNPHDLVVVEEKRAYVSRYNETKMLIVNPFSGKRFGTVDLAAYADDDGLPEMSGMALFNGKIYASIQRIDMAGSWDPVPPSYIVVIDAESGEIDDEISLTGTNPYSSPEYNRILKKFVITETGSFSSNEDGGIELLDPENNSTSGFVVKEETLGGSIAKGIIVSETKGYAIVGVQAKNGLDTHLVVFNPETGKKVDTLLKGNGWIFSQIVLTPDGKELWLTDSNDEKSGIRIFDTETDKEKTDIPINVGLPPTDICFTR